MMLGLSKMRAALGDYASSPTLYKWDVKKQRFTVHQELAQTAVAAMALIREGEEAHLVLVPITQGAAECGGVPPVAEVVQWDRDAQRFDLLMSITDAEYTRLTPNPKP